jgi:hypothetical protein
LIRSTWFGAQAGIRRITTLPPFDRSRLTTLPGSWAGSGSTAVGNAAATGSDGLGAFLASAGVAIMASPSRIGENSGNFIKGTFRESTTAATIAGRFPPVPVAALDSEASLSWQ